MATITGLLLSSIFKERKKPCARGLPVASCRFFNVRAGDKRYGRADQATALTLSSWNLIHASEMPSGTPGLKALLADC